MPLLIRFAKALELIDENKDKPFFLYYHKAKTLKKRLIPGAREHSEVFAFILESAVGERMGGVGGSGDG